jgi:hypothetical protein
MHKGGPDLRHLNPASKEYLEAIYEWLISNSHV